MRSLGRILRCRPVPKPLGVVSRSCSRSLAVSSSDSGFISEWPSLLGRRSLRALALQSTSTPGRQSPSRCFSSSDSSTSLRKTPLYDLHLVQGAMLVTFGGFFLFFLF